MANLTGKIRRIRPSEKKKEALPPEPEQPVNGVEKKKRGRPRKTAKKEKVSLSVEEVNELHPNTTIVKHPDALYVAYFERAKAASGSNAWSIRGHNRKFTELGEGKKYNKFITYVPTRKEAERLIAKLTHERLEAIDITLKASDTTALASERDEWAANRKLLKETKEALNRATSDLSDLEGELEEVEAREESYAAKVASLENDLIKAQDNLSEGSGKLGEYVVERVEENELQEAVKDIATLVKEVMGQWDMESLAFSNNGASVEFRRVITGKVEL